MSKPCSYGSSSCACWGNDSDVCAFVDARRIVANIPPLTDAECDAAALDYAQTRLREIQAQLEVVHSPYRLHDGDVVCRECSEPDGWNEPDGPYLYPTVHLVEWPCRTLTEVARG